MNNYLPFNVYNSDPMDDRGVELRKAVNAFFL
jgi:hypothetical protein